MTVKRLYLVGQNKEKFIHDIQIDQYHDFESLLLAIATQYNIVNPTSIGLHASKGQALDGLDALLDCDEEEIGITIDGHEIKDIQGPRGLPFVGSYYEVFPDHLGNHARLFETYGPIIKYDTMGKMNYLTNDPAIATVVFDESGFFSKHITEEHPLYGVKNNKALFFCDTDTDAWRKAHKFIPPAMTPNAVRHYTPMIQDTVRETFKVFDKLDEDNEAWNVYQYMLKLASQAVFHFTLGFAAHHFEEVDTPTNELVLLIAKAQQLNIELAARASWTAKLTKVPGTLANELQHTLDRLWVVLNKAINEAPVGDTDEDLHMKDAAVGASCVVDYLKRATDDQGNKLPRDLIFPNMLPVAGAGFTTTSALLSWMLYSMCAYEGNQDRLLQEIVDAGIDDNTRWTPELSDSLVFLDKFIKETQRRHNPAFTPARTAKVDCIVPGGYKVPAGAVIVNAIHAVHTNPSTWSEPLRFDPDRWDTEEVKKRPRNSYIPFAAGPRGCPGFNFALGEVKIMIPSLVYRYEFTKEGDDAVTYDPEFQLIRPMNFYIRARKRTTWPKPSANAKKVAEQK